MKRAAVRAEVRGGRAPARSAPGHRAQPRAPEGGHRPTSRTRTSSPSTARATASSSTSSGCGRAGSTAARPSPSAARSSPTRSCCPRSSTSTTTRAASCPRRCCSRSSRRAWRAWSPCSPSARASGSASWCPSAARSTSWCSWPPRTPSRPSSSASAPRTRRTRCSPRLQQKLHLRNYPRRMECFDISHFQGSSIVASQVAVTDGEADKSRYRRYKIKTLEKQDDFASMYEVLSRRLKRGLEEKDLPDLLVIDGGKGQLASAHAAMKDLGDRQGGRRGPRQESRPGGVRSRRGERSQPRARLRPRPEGPHRPAAELRRDVHAHPHARRGPPLRHHLPGRRICARAASALPWRTSPGWERCAGRCCCATSDHSSGSRRPASRSWPRWSVPRLPSGSMPPFTATPRRTRRIPSARPPWPTPAQRWTKNPPKEGRQPVRRD